MGWTRRNCPISPRGATRAIARRAPHAALLAALAGSLLAQPLAAQERQCPSIAALLGADPRAAGELSIGFARDGTVELRHRDRADAITGAQECTLSGPPGELELDCGWRYDLLDEALGRIELLAQRITRCTSTQLDDVTSPSSVEGLTVHRRLNISNDFGMYDDTGSTSIELVLYEHGDDAPGRFSLRLYAYR